MAKKKTEKTEAYHVSFLLDETGSMSNGDVSKLDLNTK